MPIVFVYGSLKRGFSNQHWLEDQRFQRKANTAPLYRMFDYGGYPALVLAQPLGLLGNPITGELWEVEPDALAQLDILEGVDQGLYQRTEILLATDGDHEKNRAISYLYLRDTSDLPDVGDTWTRAMDAP